jgi:hypothetical protein
MAQGLLSLMLCEVSMEKLLVYKRQFLLLFIVLIIGLPGHALTIYLRATGSSDGNSGLSYTKAVRTLQRAHQILLNRKPNEPVTIRVGPGKYHCRGMTKPWTFRNGHPVVITSVHSLASPANQSHADARRPVFYGVTPSGELCANRRSIWMVINHGKVNMNLTIRNLKVTRYRGAITIQNPFSSSSTRVNQNVRVNNMAFMKIGDQYYPQNTAGKAAILLTNTYGSRFEKNYFYHIKNNRVIRGKSTKGLIHAFYFSSKASRHVVRDNVILGFTGSAIKLTNYSNANLFEYNRFSYGPTAIVDRWCGSKEDPSICAGGIAQCPSWNNDFSLRNNRGSNLSLAYRAIIQPIPRGQDCGIPPPRSNLRIHLGYDRVFGSGGGGWK